MNSKKQKQATLAMWIAVVPLALAMAACAVPGLWAHQPALAFALVRGFSLVCHQNAERCFVLFGGTVAVCARCLGIYLGAAAGLAMRVSRPTAVRWFATAVGVSALEWVSEVAGFHGNWMGVRLALGFAVGATAATLVTSARPAAWVESASASGASVIN